MNLGLNYIIDVYQMNANSAIAANTMVRSLAGAGFPLFAVAMYHTCEYKSVDDSLRCADCSSGCELGNISAGVYPGGAGAGTVFVLQVRP